MGKFSGILIGTDWDGTLYCNETISEENMKAIRYFQENGGLFTICSGRYYEFLKQFTHIVHPNTYTVCYNGGLITNIDTNEVLYSGFCDGYVFEIVDKILKLGIPYHSVNIYDDVMPKPQELTVEEYINGKESFKNKNIYKVLLKTDTPANGELGSKLANELDLRDYIAVRSWEVSLEIMKKENAKGIAMKRIAEVTGARLTVGVGNYENDIELLKETDISYAVADAPDNVKAYAKRIAHNSLDSALAHIIYEIEKEFCN